MKGMVKEKLLAMNKGRKKKGKHASVKQGQRFGQGKAAPAAKY